MKNENSTCTKNRKYIKDDVKIQLDYMVKNLYSNEEIKPLLGLQTHHTPFSLINNMMSQLVKDLKKNCCTLKNKKIGVYNLEWIPVLVYIYGVKKTDITFLTDSKFKTDYLNAFYKDVNVLFYRYENKNLIVDEINMKFDIILGNPPYQDPEKQQHPMWIKCVELAFKYLKTNGYLCMIHPPAWRKPEHELLSLIKNYNLIYLEIHNATDGQSTFHVTTRYDWYICQKSEYNGKTTIVDENGNKFEMNIRDKNCIPHAGIDIFEKLCDCKIQNNRLDIIQNSDYHTQTSLMSDKKTTIFKHPCIHATKENDNVIYYSSERKGSFGVSKVIVGSASPWNAFFDENGKYGITQNCFGIVVENSSHGKLIEKVFKTKKFRKFCLNLKWSGMAFDNKVMKSFKKDFWREFIDENGKELS